MSPHEIKPKQLRALLLLLVLLPLIPTVLMVRFILDLVQSEHDFALERLRNFNQQTLLKAEPALARQVRGRTGAVTAEEVHAFYRSLIDRESAVTITDRDGRMVAGEPRSPNALLAQASLRKFSLPWQVEVSLDGKAGLAAGVKEQVSQYAWTVLSALAAVAAIAVAAAITVGRQIAIHELKTTTVATVAHELRTPLASMRLLVDTLREGRYRGESQLQEYLDLVAGESLRLSRLIDNFLTLSRLERNEHAILLQPTSPRAVIDQAVSAMRAKLDLAHCHFTIDAAETLPDILADRDALAMVLVNLLDNAVKYTAPEDKIIVLRARTAYERVFFSVQDNGIGLSRAERKNVFRRFYQVDQKLSRARGGCGLGLALVQHIVEEHHGRIDISSQLGRGSTFTVSIPLCPVPEPAPAWKES